MMEQLKAAHAQQRDQLEASIRKHMAGTGTGTGTGTGDPGAGAGAGTGDPGTGAGAGMGSGPGSGLHHGASTSARAHHSPSSLVHNTNTGAAADPEGI